MRIEATATDSALVNPDGSASSSVVLDVRWQPKHRAKWHQANVVSPSGDIPTALETMASYLRAQQAPPAKVAGAGAVRA